jgi:molecular chaperone HtpG
VGDDVAKVRFSRKLTTQPCCLTTEGGLTLEMEKYFRRGPSPEMRSIRATRVLELNAEHKAVQALKAAFDSGDRDKAKTLSLILTRLAEMLSGAEVEDPAAFAALVAELF